MAVLATSATHKFLEIMLVIDLDGQLSALVDEWPVFLISRDICIIKVAANQTEIPHKSSH
jgi:hypothetical protein